MTIQHLIWCKNKIIRLTVGKFEYDNIMVDTEHLDLRHVSKNVQQCIRLSYLLTDSDTVVYINPLFKKEEGKIEGCIHKKKHESHNSLIPNYF